MTSDDDAWIDGLRGKPRPDADPLTLAQAHDLRRALAAQRHNEESAAPLAGHDDPGLQKLMFRLRREQLLDPPAEDHLREASRTTGRWRVPAAAAAVVVVGVVLTLGLLQPPESDPDTLRSASAAQVLKVADVRAEAARIASELRAAGASVMIVDLGQGGIEVAATVPPGSREKVAQVLAPHALQLPGTDGSLRLELQPLVTP